MDLAHTTQGSSGGIFYRGAALAALAEKWPDETTRKLLENRAVQDPEGYPRGTALQTLAEKWPDEATRKLLENRAVQDEDGGPRIAALPALADKWPDEATHKLLAERAVQDEDENPRIAALQALAEKWPDETTRKLLEECAVDASLTGDQRAAHSVVLGNMHSEFGRIVFTKDLDGIAPYLDPAQAISREHIERAAKEANVPTDKIDDTVHSLSEHLGWDIEKGAAG